MQKLPLLIGLVLGAALFAAALLVPGSRLDSLIAPTGLAAMIPQAAPPLGMTARLALGALGFAVAAGAGWLLSRGGRDEEADLTAADERPTRRSLHEARSDPAVGAPPPAPARDWNAPPPAPAREWNSRAPATLSRSEPAASAAPRAYVHDPADSSQPSADPAPLLSSLTVERPAPQPAPADHKAVVPTRTAEPAIAERTIGENATIERLADRLIATEERLAAQMAQMAQQLAEIAATTRQIARTPAAAPPPPLAAPRIRAAEFGGGERRARIARVARDLRASLPSVEG